MASSFHCRILREQLKLFRCWKRFYSNKDFVKVVEVGPRDGLQNEKEIIDTDVKIQLIDKLSETGLSVIEVTSFVSPKWVPQMSDHSAVMTGIKRKSGVSYPALVPNMQGFYSAVKAGVKEIAIFASASEAFSKKNINCTIEESLKRFEPVCNAAIEKDIKVRGYVSCVVGCPYEGIVQPDAVSKVAQHLIKLGCYEISLGDTIGIGSPESISLMLSCVKEDVPVSKLAIHCHDTYGKAISNIEAAIELGIRVVDSSVGGLGGCPYAKGASGNVATENVLQMLHNKGKITGVDVLAVINIAKWIKTILSRSRVQQ
ncbi:hydroxymethylglutaryl-CoA lyase, mitochondrial isoform X2 [Hydra vulgaris]|uniref:hydroxymethylglutaryl-CoA lyase n=1 Tax=Hydra vulgaris TaxID=6087 RepID=T2M8H7_HYDVU|nr:hydroxymethylglutaryl-CoA lyase, mitochondrial isoform X2 [Hydra vulgaris]